jgi:hypothetical protein
MPDNKKKIEMAYLKFISSISERIEVKSTMQTKLNSKRSSKGLVEFYTQNFNYKSF